MTEFTEIRALAVIKKQQIKNFETGEDITYGFIKRSLGHGA